MGKWSFPEMMKNLKRIFQCNHHGLAIPLLKPCKPISSGVPSKSLSFKGNLCGKGPEVPNC